MHSGKNSRILVHLEKGQFSDKMFIKIAKMPKMPRITIYIAIFDPKEALKFLFLLAYKINNFFSARYEQKSAFFLFL